uniref:Info solute carrier family 35 member F2, like n=1 Tax=Cyprinus carpio TaxID=7962 RepID=A0A8C2K695_CYPCA
MVQLFQSVFITVKLYKTLLMGQGLSALISGTAVTSQYLASIFYLNTPMLQSFINCTLLGITYTVALIFRRGDGNILHILKTKWWKYLLLGLTDVEANYAVVKAYQYTTLTSIQLLDCFIIPVLMILSWFFLKTRYRIIHYVAVCTVYVWLGWEPWWERISLLQPQCRFFTVHFYGIFFCTSSALFYFVTYRGIVEHKVFKIQWTWEIGLIFRLSSPLILAGYALLIKMSSATAVNFSLPLQPVLWALLVQVHFNIFSIFTSFVLLQFSELYIVSLVAILVGFIMFNTVPSLNRALAPASNEEGCEFDKDSTQGCVDETTCAQAEQDQIKSPVNERQSACLVINSVKM